MPQSKHLIALVTVVAIMTWAWVEERQLRCRQKPSSQDSAKQLQPGGLSPHGAQGQATRPSCPKGSHRPPHPSPSWPSMPPSQHQPLTSYGKLDSDILGMSLWPTLNCKGWELQTSVLCKGAQPPPLKERQGNHWPLANSLLTRPS